MGLRGPKPKGKVKLQWSANFAYAIGLIATDGCLYRDGLHINFTSKDSEQIDNFQTCLGINCSIGKKAGRKDTEKKYFVVQIGDVLFHKFLMGIGITPAKSKTMGALDVPEEYFFDFLRGSFDGDGCAYSYWDKRWKSSFMFYITFASASKQHTDWLRENIFGLAGIKGHISKSVTNPCYQLRYAKRESVILFDKMFYSPEVVCLNRKKLKIKGMLAIVDRLLE